MQTLLARTITREAFAPYGWLIDATGHAGRAINDGNSLRIDGLSELSHDAQGGAPCLAVFRAQARDPAGPWEVLERHALGTQTFVPLNGARCVVLVALGSPSDKAPDAATLAAFSVAGHQGITLRAGTWHHALLAPAGGDFVVIERSAAAGDSVESVDCDLAHLVEPVHLVFA